jgi:molecular chaperone DnaK (HSP70)
MIWESRKSVPGFREAGFTVACIFEDPTAPQPWRMPSAYGRKEGVDYIIVYDFGDGKLDVSLLHVSDGFVHIYHGK